jgi:hypothetical protein
MTDDHRTKSAPGFQQTVDAEGNVQIECLMGPYRGQYLKVLEAVGAAAIADKWAREPLLTFDPEAPPLVLTPEETETAVMNANAAAAFLRGDEGAEPYPPTEPIGLKRAADDDHPSRKHR